MKKAAVTTIFKEQSPISGLVVVRDNGETRELFVKGTKQTSWSENPDIFEGTYWKAAVSIPFTLPSNTPKFLVIGLGGGTIPKLLSQKYSKSEILCLEIDPVIIQIANSYFQLKDFPHIKTIKANANNWIIRNAKKYQEYFDGIVIDSFFGETFSFDTQVHMMQKVHNMLKKNGVAVTNRIYNEYETKVDAFIMQLSDLFSEQVTHIIEGYSGNDNILIFSKKS